MTGPRPSSPPASESPITKVDTLLAGLPRLFSTALLAHVRQAPDAAVKTREALNAIETARAELARLERAGGAALRPTTGLSR